MGTPSYNRFATCTATVMRSPGVDADGKIGVLSSVGTIQVTPPDTMDASAILGFGIQNPHKAFVIYYEGTFEFFKSDRFVIEGTTYNLRNIRPFPNYRNSDNTSYEIVIEEPEK